MLLAAVMACIVLSYHLCGFATIGLAGDGARIASFVLVAFVIGSARDREEAGKRALRRSERRYRVLIENDVRGIAVCRTEEILFANARLGEMLGRSARELVGSSPEDLVSPEDRPAFRLLESQGQADGHRPELRLARADGTFLWVEAATSPTDFGEQPALLINFDDITARKEAEARRRELAEIARKQEEQLEHTARLAELGEMAAAISHELNQPLTGIRNYARNAFYMLEKKAGSEEEIKGNLRLISNQVDRAAKIINEMRELTRRSDHQPGFVSINSVIRETADFLLPQMRLSGVDVHCSLDEGLPDIRGDRIRLAQVLLNLLTNARQAMEDSRIRRLDIRSHGEGDGGDSLVVEVSDTGKGFSEEDAQKLFVPFFTTKKSGHGTGLGLSISSSIIKDHGGTIQARGARGQGATFTIRLPLPAAVQQMGAEP